MNQYQALLQARSEGRRLYHKPSGTAYASALDAPGRYQQDGLKPIDQEIVFHLVDATLCAECIQDDEVIKARETGMIAVAEAQSKLTFPQALAQLEAQQLMLANEEYKQWAADAREMLLLW